MAGVQDGGVTETRLWRRLVVLSITPEAPLLSTGADCLTFDRRRWMGFYGAEQGDWGVWAEDSRAIRGADATRVVAWRWRGWIVADQWGVQSKGSRGESSKTSAWGLCGSMQLQVVDRWLKNGSDEACLLVRGEISSGSVFQGGQHRQAGSRRGRADG